MLLHMKLKTIIKLTLLALVLIVTLGACEYPPTNRVFIAGDSLTVQTAITGGAIPTDWDVVSGLGWQAEHVQPHLEDRVTDPLRSPGVLVIALGQNDAGPDGLSQQDKNQFAALEGAVHPDTRVAWVLPWSSTPADRVQRLEDFRGYVGRYVATHPACIVDWMPIAQAHPEYLDVDGTHLSVAGRHAYGALLQEAAACAL